MWGFMKTEKYIVDRIEDGVLVLVHCENESELSVKSTDSGEKISEGDVIYVTFDENNGIAEITVDREETAQRKKEMKRKLKSLFDN